MQIQVENQLCMDPNEQQNSVTFGTEFQRAQACSMEPNAKQATNPSYQPIGEVWTTNEFKVEEQNRVQRML